RRHHLLEAALLLIQRGDLGDYEPSLLQGHLNRVPDRCLAVGEHHGHPAPRLEYPVVLSETAVHQVLIFRNALLANTVDDGFRVWVRLDAVPRLDKKIQVGVVDVFAERWIRE